MIRWCSYCQKFLGERAPFDDPAFTHGICDRCDMRLERDEPLTADTAPLRTLFNRLLTYARAGDEAACEAIVSSSPSGRRERRGRRDLALRSAGQAR